MPPPSPCHVSIRLPCVYQARRWRTTLLRPGMPMELPRGLTPAQLTGGFGVSDAIPLDGRIEESFGRQLEALPAQTRRLVQLAAADPSGDPVLVWRAAGRLAIGAGAAEPAVQAGLAEFGARVRFRHPLVRSAAYRSASVQTRQELHGALAEVTDPAADPDRRAWHRAQAAPGPDEDVAAELEHGVPDPVAGNQVMACIVLRPGASLTPAELGAFLAGQGDIGRKQHPRFVRIASQIPRTVTFKVLTRVLAADRWNTPDPVWWRPDGTGAPRRMSCLTRSRRPRLTPRSAPAWAGESESVRRCPVSRTCPRVHPRARSAARGGSHGPARAWWPQPGRPRRYAGWSCPRTGSPRPAGPARHRAR